MVKAKKLPAGKTSEDELEIEEDENEDLDEKRKTKPKVRIINVTLCSISEFYHMVKQFLFQKISQKLSDCVNYIEVQLHVLLATRNSFIAYIPYFL